MKQQVNIIILLACTLLSGCVSRAIYQNAKFSYNHPPLDPPQQNRWLTIDGVIPPEVKVTMVPYYYSTKGCARNSGAVASRYDLIYPESGRYSVKVAFDGGSRCGWQLYKIDISSKMKDPNYYNARIPIASQFAVIKSAAATHTFTFGPANSDNLAKEISRSPRYYPFASLYEIEKGYPASASKSVLWLNPVGITNSSSSDGWSTGSVFYYQAAAAPAPLGTIHFSPLVDHDYLVYKTTEGSQLKGNFVYRYYYPNGDITENESLRDYRYYEKKAEPKKKNWWDDIPDKPVKPYTRILE